MKIIDVSLPTTQLVEDFVEALSGLRGDFELISDNYLLDARSLMSVFSLDRTKPMKLKIYNYTQETADALKPFVISGEE